MILVDANILIYASVQEARQHRAARGWLEERLAGPARVGLPWPSLLAFVRISTNARICREPFTLSTAWEQVQTWLGYAAAWVPEPTDRHADVLGDLLRTRGLRPDDVSDAHVAAIAIEHGLTLCSCDDGFARFEGLRWDNPLD